MRVSELADVCRSIQPVRESTYANWQKALKPLEHLQIAEVNKAVALQYRSKLLQPNGPLKQNTLKQRIATLRDYGIKQLTLNSLVVTTPGIKLIEDWSTFVVIQSYIRGSTTATITMTHTLCFFGTQVLGYKRLLVYIQKILWWIQRYRISILCINRTGCLRMTIPLGRCLYTLLVTDWFLTFECQKPKTQAAAGVRHLKRIWINR